LFENIAGFKEPLDGGVHFVLVAVGEFEGVHENDVVFLVECKCAVAHVAVFSEYFFKEVNVRLRGKGTDGGVDFQVSFVFALGMVEPFERGGEIGPGA
jgi:hypothetical protein